MSSLRRRIFQNRARDSTGSRVRRARFARCYQRAASGDAAWEASRGTAEQASRAYRSRRSDTSEGISTQLELNDSRILMEQATANRALAARNLQIARIKLALLPIFRCKRALLHRARPRAQMQQQSTQQSTQQQAQPNQQQAILLVASGLMIRSFLRVLSSSPGIDVRTPRRNRVGWRPRSVSGSGGFLARDARTSPAGSRRARRSGDARDHPIHGSRRQTFAIDGRTNIIGGNDMQAGDILVSAEYYRTMGIPLVKGRAFTDNDSRGRRDLSSSSARVSRGSSFRPRIRSASGSALQNIRR